MSGVTQSETTEALFAALVRAQRAVRDPEKDRQNPQLRNRYATLESVLDVVRPAFQDQGIAILQCPGEVVDGCVHLQMQVVHESGQWLRTSASCPLVGFKGSGDNENKGINAAQSYGIVVSYLRRYMLMSLAAVVQVDEDTDGHVESRREAPRERQPEERPAAPEVIDDVAKVVAAFQYVDAGWTEGAIAALLGVQRLQGSARAPAVDALAKAKAGKINPPTREAKPVESDLVEDVEPILTSFAELDRDWTEAEICHALGRKRLKGGSKKDVRALYARAKDNQIRPRPDDEEAP